MLLDGVHVPLTTPFYPDGRLYLRKLEHNVRRYSLTPVSGLIALAPGSEAASLSDEEQREVLRTVAETATPEKVLTATLNHPGCGPALHLAEYAASLRFDVLRLQAPAIYAGTDGETSAELLTWFRVIADRAPLPVLLGTHAGATPIAMDSLADLATHPNVLGAVEQSEHISRVVELRRRTAEVRREVTTTTTFTAATWRMLQPSVGSADSVPSGFVSAASLTGVTVATEPALPSLKTRTKQVGTQILWARVIDAVEALQAGAVGIAPAVAAGVPQAVFEIWAAWKDGDKSLMREKQARLAAVEPRILASGAPLLKTAAELSGYFGGRPRLPMVAPGATQQQELASLLDGIRS